MRSLRCCSSFLQLQNCTGILCDVRERKRGKRKQARKCGWRTSPLCASCTRRRDGREGKRKWTKVPERMDKHGRKKGKNVKGLWTSLVISNHPSLWLSLALSNPRRQPSRRLCGSLHTFSARTRCNSSAGSHRQRGRLRILLVRVCCVKA